jgi:hypothetical protein
MFTSIETTERVKLTGGIPHAFEKDVLRYTGSRRYVANWWSEDFQSLVCADGEIWRVGDVDEDGWVWWTFTLTLSNDFDINSLGFEPEFPMHVLLLDLKRREVWIVPIGAGFNVLVTQGALDGGKQPSSH